MRVYVFGSNLAGRHGAGSAKYARENYGAVYGQGVGPQGRSYAIPTKDRDLKTLPLSEIAKHVKDFLAHARVNPYDTFEVVRIGCGLAGYKKEEIAPLFAGATLNVELPPGWRDHDKGTKAPQHP